MNARFLFLRTTGLFIAWISACNVLAQEPTPAENQAEFEQYSIVNAEWFKEAPGDDALRKLLKGRYVEAVTMLQLQQRRYKDGVASFDGNMEASDNVLAAGLDLASTPEDKLTILSRYVAVTKQAEELTKAKEEGGMSSSLDLSLARYQRMDAEIQLLRAQREIEEAPQVDHEPRQLLSQRHDDAIDLQQLKQGQYEGGSAGYEAVLSARRDVLLAELELATQPDERIALLSQYLEMWKEAEKLVTVKREGRMASALDYHQARYFRMDAEIRLLRAKEALEKGKSKNAEAIVECSSMIAAPCCSSRPCRVPWRARGCRR